MDKFNKKVVEVSSGKNVLPPPPPNCTACGCELNQESGEVRYISAWDHNLGRGVVKHGGYFIDINREGNFKKDKNDNYLLKSQFINDRMNWVVWCDRCHSDRLIKQEPHRKTNQRHNSVDQAQAMKFLKGMLHMKNQTGGKDAKA